MIPNTDNIIQIASENYNGAKLICAIMMSIIVYNVILLIGSTIKKRKLLDIIDSIKLKKKEADKNSFWDHE